MKNEIDFLSPIEKELRFNEWCSKKNVTMFLSDLDDSICTCRGTFRFFMSQAYDYLSLELPTVSKDKWKKEIEITNNRLFEKFGVNSKRWDYMVNELSERHLFSSKIEKDVKDIFQQIYFTPPEMLEGAEEGLEFLMKTGIPVGIVTHAGPEWTYRKYKWLNLDKYFKWEDIFIVDQDNHKTSDSWKKAMHYFNTDPINCAVIGDSPRSDINPVWELGTRQCFLVEDPNQWSVHNEDVDERVKKIKNLNQIADAVLGEN